MYNRYACNTCNVCLPHKLFIQHKPDLQIMAVYIIFTINILHFCLGVRGSSTSVAFCTFLADVTGTSELSDGAAVALATVVGRQNDCNRRGKRGNF